MIFSDQCITVSHEIDVVRKVCVCVFFFNIFISKM